MVMDSPYVHTIDDLVQTHITNQKSIPIFLGSHQIDLFRADSSYILEFLIAFNFFISVLFISLLVLGQIHLSIRIICQ